MGSKSFNNLDENEQCAPLSRGGVAAPGLRSMSFNGILGSNEDSSSRNQVKKCKPLGNQPTNQPTRPRNE